ncbi:MAG: SDR family oxidoreductase [Caulobacterales bacterium]|nr:SDR family oxidoreductase [Caulobacterales bacterium]
MASYPSLKNLPVLVSGGAAGIGAAVVELLMLQGAQVAFLDLDEEAAKALVEHVGARCGRCPLFEPCDLRDLAASAQAAGRLEERMGGFGALVNNAGNDAPITFGAVTPDQWRDCMAANLDHQFFLAQAVAPGMAGRGGGAIVNLGSTVWQTPARGVAPYAIAKAAIEGLTRTLARELGEQNIRVNGVAPGWVLTQRQQGKADADPAKVDSYLARQCLKSLLRPSDVAELVLWLCADESRLCTGHIFVVDAGLT